MNQDTVEAACNEACRNISELIRSRKESGKPLPTSEVLAVGLQRLLSYGITTQENLWDCVDVLHRKAADLKFQKLVVRGG